MYVKVFLFFTNSGVLQNVNRSETAKPHIFSAFSTRKRPRPSESPQNLLSFKKIIVILRPILFNCAMGPRVRG